jgi:hypothetical protein
MEKGQGDSGMQWTPEHEGIRRNVTKLIDAEINPYVDA